MARWLLAAAVWLRGIPSRTVAWVRGIPARIRNWWLTPEAKRVDRSRMYVWVHAGLAFVGISIAIRPHVGLLAELSDGTNRALAACIIIGSTLALIGSARGGADLRGPYMFAVGGQLSVIVSLVFYAWFIAAHSDLIGTMSGALSIAIAGASIHIAIVTVKELFYAVRLARNVRR